MTPCPDGGIMNDKRDALAALIADLQGAQDLCLMKQDILRGASYMLEEKGILMTWVSQLRACLLTHGCTMPVANVEILRL